MFRGDLCAQRGLARRLVNAVITELGGCIVAENRAIKLHEFIDAGKAEIGKESANTGKIGEYSQFFWRQTPGGWDNEFEYVDVYLIRYDSVPSSLWSWREGGKLMAETETYHELTRPFEE